MCRCASIVGFHFYQLVSEMKSFSMSVVFRPVEIQLYSTTPNAVILRNGEMLAISNSHENKSLWQVRKNDSRGMRE
jgi:hypothetical protein